MNLSEYIKKRCEKLEKDIKEMPYSQIRSQDRLYGRVDELEVLQKALESGEIDVVNRITTDGWK